MSIMDFIMNRDERIIEEFNDFITNQKDAIAMFCSCSYTEPSLKQKYLNQERQETPTRKSKYSVKVRFVSLKEIILNNYAIEREHKKEVAFITRIINDPLRNEYYKDFLLRENQTDKLYCIGHLSNLDSYIESRVKKEYESLSKNFPEAIKHLNPDADTQINTLFKIIQQREELPIIQNKILKSKFFETWVLSQREFSKQCRDIIHKISLKWKYSTHKVPIQKYQLKSDSLVDSTLNVTQIYLTPFAPNHEYDESLCGELINARKKNIEFVNRERYYKERVYEQIISLIQTLQNKYKNKGQLLVFFADSGVDDSENLNEYHFSQLFEYLKDDNLAVKAEKLNYEDGLPVGSPMARLVVVDLISTNDSLVSNCKQIFNSHLYWFNDEPKYFKQAYCDVIYISLRKELSEKEMNELILLKKRDIEKEQKRKKEAEKREHVRDITKKQFVQRTQNWTLTRGAIRTFSMYNYYPTTCDVLVDDLDWTIRKLIWNFKASPTTRQSIETIISLHEGAMNKLIPQMIFCLEYFFADYLHNMTFVCIPASSKEKTERRYNDFSQIVCRKTGMKDGNSHVRIKSDSSAKHLGGIGIIDITIDEDYFQDKFVLLFDDIITSGRTMIRFSEKLKKSGAIVIGGFSFGLTKHNWDSHPISDIYRDWSNDLLKQEDRPRWRH